MLLVPSRFLLLRFWFEKGPVPRCIYTQLSLVPPPFARLYVTPKFKGPGVRGQSWPAACDAYTPRDFNQLFMYFPSSIDHSSFVPRTPDTRRDYLSFLLFCRIGDNVDGIPRKRSSKRLGIFSFDRSSIAIVFLPLWKWDKPGGAQAGRERRNYRFIGAE